MTVSRWRWVAASVLALAPVATVVSGAVLTPVSAADPAATESATIDHAQPTEDGVRLLVSVPGTGQVDLTGVQVRIGGDATTASAVTAAASSDVSRTSILAIDTSDSMRGARIAAAKQAAKVYLSSVPGNVKVGVLTFDDAVHLVVKPGLDRGAARAAVERLTLTRNTALYDGVLGALQAAGPGGEQAGQRKILVLSDGKDTTTTSLTSVTKAIKASGATVDVVSLQAGDEANQALGVMATTGKGTVLNATDATGLTAAFAGEADALARQIVVTAKVPDGKSTSANVDVSVPVAETTVTATAYLPVREAAAKPAASPGETGPTPVSLGRWTVSREMVLGGVGAMGVGALGVILALAFGKPKQSKEQALAAQMHAYGIYSGPADQQAGSGQGSLGDSARHAAERALASNSTLEARIAARLDAAGMALKPAEWLLIHSGVAVASALVGLLLGRGSIVMALIFLAVGIVAPWLYLGHKKSKRLKAFGSGLADTLQLMSGSLSAGLSLAQSVDTIVREGAEPITSEFKRVIVESRLGVPLEDSLEQVAERMQSRDFEWVVMAIKIQREVGGNLAELLLTVAGTLREREFLRRHVRALSAEGRLSAYILGGLPPVFLLYLTLTKPDYVHGLYTTPIGWVLCAVMGVLLGVGVLWMSKVAKVDV